MRFSQKKVTYLLSFITFSNCCFQNAWIQNNVVPTYHEKIKNFAAIEKID